jgi:hypothetical protein
LSLTLRDAQHLSWKTFKKFELMNEKLSARFSSENAFTKKAEEIALKMKTLPKESLQSKDELSKLFSELLFSLFVLSERNGVSLEDAFLQNVDDLILSFMSQ